MSRDAKAVFSPGPMVLFRSAHKISSYLVTAKLCPIERFVGSAQCKKRKCEICVNVTETYTFSCNATGKTFQINHELDKDDKCLIYLLNCKFFKKQYVGEETDAFRLRWNNYKANDRNFPKNEGCIQQHLYKHFYGEGHNGFLGSFSISFIEKTNGFQHKKRESYSMETLKILAPLGINIESTV